MTKFFFSPILLLQLTILNAQNHESPSILCGNEIFEQILKSQHPAFHQQLEQSYWQNLENSKHLPSTSRSSLNIKVVVHVVWKESAENLHDSIILSQLAVLNEDFNRQNTDTANLRAEFQPVAGNPQVHFELVDIKRVKTNSTFKLDLLGGELMANLKKSSTGGSDATDPTQYLNIWVCKIQPTTFLGLPLGQILGFAFPPNNYPNWPANAGAPEPGQDGVVIDFRMFGRYNPNSIQIPGGGGTLKVQGRTATHEVGHFLGLRHIWGDGGLLGANDCNQSDGIDDTPFANAQSNFDCNKNRNTCQKVEPFYGKDMPDLVENYMDYSSESCMNMFSQGQVAVIRAVLEGPRKGLIENTSSLSNLSKTLEIPHIFPNPCVAATTPQLWLPPYFEAQKIEIFDASGRMIQSLPVAIQPFEQNIALPTQHLPAGIYSVRVQQQQISKLLKMVILH